MADRMLDGLEPDLQDRVRRLAAAQGRTAAALLHEAVGRYVVHAEAQEALQAGARAAWAEFQATGRHADGTAVDAWLAMMEAGHPAEPPPCRS